MKEEIIKILRTIAKLELDKKSSEVSYNIHRTLIKSLFQKETDPSLRWQQVLLRLTIIDSLYATNAAYFYFSLKEMADRICKLGTDEKAREYFNEVLNTPEDKEKIFSIFSKRYGIRKNLSEGSQQMSLLSKYAYYALMQDKEHYPLGFPIYDSLAREVYPKVCEILGITPITKIQKIEKYLQAVKQLKEALFDDDNLFEGYQQYDILDAYLWRMGKFEHGNLSALLNRDEYELFIKNLELNVDSDEKDSDYKEQFNGTKTVTEKKGRFDFGEAVVSLCADKKTEPFKGLDNEEYLNQLLEHWRIFYNYKRIYQTLKN